MHLYVIPKNWPTINELDKDLNPNLIKILPIATQAQLATKPI
jgi:hypothetical protein